MHLYIIGLSIILFGSIFSINSDTVIESIVYTCFLFYFGLIFYQLLKKIYLHALFDNHVIIGVATGYLLLGTIGFFLFCLIEQLVPGSFSTTESLHSIRTPDTPLTETLKSNPHIFSGLYYFSYITLATVGYGEIYPVSVVAQQGVFVITLMGQLYLALIVSVVVGKYINHN